ncbi:hypothetical protein Tco_0463781, partial [Tanacetum coccineum]
MASEFWCQITPTEFWCHGISGVKLHFADVAPLLKFGTTTPCALRHLVTLASHFSLISYIRILSLHPTLSHLKSCVTCNFPLRTR